MNALTQVSKETAHYSPRSTHPGEACSGCTMFRPPHSCTAVYGKIDPKGWCKYYEAKTKEENK